MWNWVAKLDELRRAGQPVAVATVTATSGSAPREPGAKMLVLSDGRIFGTIGGGRLESLAIEDARRAIAEDARRVVRYPLGAKAGQCCGGVVDVFFEVINAGPVLYLFGAGHVGQALCRVLAGTPFAVHVTDERPEWLDAPELPADVVRHPGEWTDFVREVPWDAARTYVAIMTHRHDTDQDIVADVINRPARYIGLIGSESKWARFRQRLTAREVPEAALARVKCPIGLHIGGKAPQEVAISIAAELLKCLHGV
jgi:xanthine dehydrogenase accessory factor